MNGRLLGYSGTPLAKKLGIAPGSRVTLLDEPDGFRALLDPLSETTAERTRHQPAASMEGV